MSHIIEARQRFTAATVAVLRRNKIHSLVVDSEATQRIPVGDFSPRNPARSERRAAEIKTSQPRRILPLGDLTAEAGHQSLCRPFLALHYHGNTEEEKRVVREEEDDPC